MPRETVVNGQTRIRVWVPWEMDPADHTDLVDYCKANDKKPRELLLQGAKELVMPILDEWRALAPQRAAEAAANPKPAGRSKKSLEELAAIAQAKADKEQAKATAKAERDAKRESAAAERKSKADARETARAEKAAAKAAAEAEKLKAKQAKIEADLAEKQRALDEAKARAAATTPMSPVVEQLETEVIDEDEVGDPEPDDDEDNGA